MAMIIKTKFPEKICDETTKEFYRENGNRFVEEGNITVGYRYDQVEKRKLSMPDGREFTNNVTLSQPSSEVLTLMKDGNKWYLVMGKQSRSPYVVDVDGQLYSKIFLEQAAGLLENDQDFVDAAIAETGQELGAKLVYLSELVAPKIYRHVSYTDEVSKLYIAVVEKLGNQELDKNENINVFRIPLKKAKKEFLKYLCGREKKFFGYDIPDVTMLSMSIFFWKLDNKAINLNHLEETLGDNMIK